MRKRPTWIIKRRRKGANLLIIDNNGAAAGAAGRLFFVGLAAQTSSRPTGRPADSLAAPVHWLLKRLDWSAFSGCWARHSGSSDSSNSERDEIEIGYSPAAPGDPTTRAQAAATAAATAARANFICMHKRPRDICRRCCCRRGPRLAEPSRQTSKRDLPSAEV